MYLAVYLISFNRKNVSNFIVETIQLHPKMIFLWNGRRSTVFPVKQDNFDSQFDLIKYFIVSLLFFVDKPLLHYGWYNVIVSYFISL